MYVYLVEVSMIDNNVNPDAINRMFLEIYDTWDKASAEVDKWKKSYSNKRSELITNQDDTFYHCRKVHLIDCKKKRDIYIYIHVREVK